MIGTFPGNPDTVIVLGKVRVYPTPPAPCICPKVPGQADIGLLCSKLTPAYPSPSLVCVGVLAFVPAGSVPTSPPSPACPSLSANIDLSVTDIA